MNLTNGNPALLTSARHHGPSWTLLAAALLLASAGAQAGDGLQTSGDIRTGYISSETEGRTGIDSSSDSFRARLRFRVAGELGAGWRASGRVAGLLDSEQGADEFWMRTYAPGPSGLQSGQGTIDEAYLEYRRDGSPWSLRLGRFQAAFGLDDVMKKSLDQNDSTNFDITWVDGAWWQWRGTDWTTHVIARHNDRRGPTGTLHPPLGFADDDSRASLFLAMESRTPIGPLVQRMLTLSWLPSALHPLGIDDPANEDYLALTAKATAEWPLGGDGMRFRLGGEVGHAVNTPRREAMRSGTGDADALSWQASFNLMDVAPGHDVGLVYGRVADGWLLSSDFRPNNSLVEVRWVWQVTPAWQVDARLRRREEIDLPTGTLQARQDDDLYLRATWKF